MRHLYRTIIKGIYLNAKVSTVEGISPYELLINNRPPASEYIYYLVGHFERPISTYHYRPKCPHYIKGQVTRCF